MLGDDGVVRWTAADVEKHDSSDSEVSEDANTDGDTSPMDSGPAPHIGLSSRSINRLSSNVARDNMGASQTFDSDTHSMLVGGSSMVAFELFDKKQMQGFFRRLWVMILLAVLYVLANLSQVAYCSQDSFYEEGFARHVATACLADGVTDFGNRTSHEVWTSCCHAWGSGNHSNECFVRYPPAGNETALHLAQRNFETCCVLELQQVFNACPSQCVYEVVNIIIRIGLSVATGFGLVVYSVRFCTHPKTMQRFEQKFVVLLFILSFILTNPYGCWVSFVNHVSTEDGAICSEGVTSQKSNATENALLVGSITSAVFGAMICGFVIAFVMTYRSATKYWTARNYCMRSFRSIRSLGYRYVMYGLLLLVYILLRVVLAFLASDTFEPVYIGAVPLFPALVLLLRLCGWQSSPPFVEFYRSLLDDAGYTSDDYIGSCGQSPETVGYVVAILATDVLLLIFIANETKATRLQLLNVGYAQSRTLQVTYRFFLTLTISMVLALEGCGCMYSFFLPTLHFWRFVYADTITNTNVSSYHPLFLLGATGGESVGNSAVLCFLSAVWTFSMAFIYLPEQAESGIKGCFRDVPNYSRLVRLSHRPDYQHTAAAANRRYHLSRQLHRKHGTRLRNLSKIRQTLESGQYEVAQEDSGAPDQNEEEHISAPDRENVFVFETVLIMCIFADLSYNALGAKCSLEDDVNYKRRQPQEPGSITASDSALAVTVDAASENSDCDDSAPKESTDERHARWQRNLNRLLRPVPADPEAGLDESPEQQRFILKPEWVLHVESTDTCVIVAEDLHDDCYIVAFKGTSSLINALDDLKMNLVPFELGDHLMEMQKDQQFKLDMRNRLAKVHVHAGFQKVYLSVRDSILELLQSILQSRHRKLRVTGHSLGGALATLCALDCVTQLASPRDVCLTTFGSPRVGNRAFAALFNSYVRCAWRVANQFDGVTRVPQACFGGTMGNYRHVGKFVLVFLNGDLVVDPSVIEKNFLHAFRVELNRHQGVSYLIGLLKWDYRTQLDAQDREIGRRCAGLGASARFANVSDADLMRTATRKSRRSYSAPKPRHGSSVSSKSDDQLEGVQLVAMADIHSDSEAVSDEDVELKGVDEANSAKIDDDNRVALSEAAELDLTQYLWYGSGLYSAFKSSGLPGLHAQGYFLPDGVAKVIEKAFAAVQIGAADSE